MIRPDGYVSHRGYVGTMPDGRKMLFVDEKEYLERLEDIEETKKEGNNYDES